MLDCQCENFNHIIITILLLPFTFHQRKNPKIHRFFSLGVYVFMYVNNCMLFLFFNLLLMFYVCSGKNSKLSFHFAALSSTGTKNSLYPVEFITNLRLEMCKCGKEMCKIFSYKLIN